MRLNFVPQANAGYSPNKTQGVFDTENRLMIEKATNKLRKMVEWLLSI